MNTVYMNLMTDGVTCSLTTDIMEIDIVCTIIMGTVNMKLMTYGDDRPTGK